MIELGKNTTDQSDYKLAHKAMLEMGAGIANFYMEVAKGNIAGHRLINTQIVPEAPYKIGINECAFIVDMRLSAPEGSLYADVSYIPLDEEQPSVMLHKFYNARDLTITVPMGPYGAGEITVFTKYDGPSDLFMQLLLIDRKYVNG